MLILFLFTQLCKTLSLIKKKSNISCVLIIMKMIKERKKEYLIKCLIIKNRETNRGTKQ